MKAKIENLFRGMLVRVKVHFWPRSLGDYGVISYINLDETKVHVIPVSQLPNWNTMQGLRTLNKSSSIYTGHSTFYQLSDIEVVNTNGLIVADAAIIERNLQGKNGASFSAGEEVIIESIVEVKRDGALVNFRVHNKDSSADIVSKSFLKPCREPAKNSQVILSSQNYNENKDNPKHVLFGGTYYNIGIAKDRYARNVEWDNGKFNSYSTGETTLVSQQINAMNQQGLFEEAEIIEEAPKKPVENDKPAGKLKLDLDLSDSVEKLVGKGVNAYIKSVGEDKLQKATEKIVKTEVEKLKPFVVKVGEAESVKIEGRLHKKFDEVLFLAIQEKQVYLAGPAGSGKTTLASQIAESLKRDFSHISCSAGLSEAHLLGRMLFDGTYVASDFVTAYENGGVFLFDEIDAADNNTLLVINSALANNRLSVPNRKEKPHAIRHENFICLCAGNTWGSGSTEYHGRNHLDAAFLDRFSVSKVEIDYDRDLEREIAGDYTEMADRLWKIRDDIKNKKLRRLVSTRAFVSGCRQRKAGKSTTEILNTFSIGWSHEEKSKVNL